MHFIALLRGINVGGNNKVSMADLKTIFQELGFTDVKTYINSGNIIFSTDKTSVEQLISKIESVLHKKYNFQIKVIVLGEKILESIMNDVPDEWKKDKDIRCYIAFVRPPVTPQEVAKEVKLNPEVDSLKVGEYVLYMTTKLEGLTKSGFKYLIGKKIFKETTIRNYNTAKKLVEMI